MQCVPVTGPVAQHQRRRPHLPGCVTLIEPLVELVGPRWLLTSARAPLPRDSEQVRPERIPQFGYDRRERSVEVPVLTLAEPVPGHIDRRPEAVLLTVEIPQCRAFAGIEDRPGRSE